QSRHHALRSLHHLRSWSAVPALLGGFALRKCAGQEDGAVLTGRSALPDQEDHVLPALQARLDAAEVVFAVHRLLIDLQNDVAARHIYVFGERTRFYILHNDSLARFHIEPVGHFGGHLANGESELALLGSVVVFTVLVITQASREELGAVRSGDGGFLRLAIANEAELNLRPRLTRGDLVDEISALDDFVAVDGGDGVADFQARLICWAASHDAGDRHAAARAVDAGDGGILYLIENDANRTWGDFW